MRKSATAILAIVMVLVAIGVIMLYSTSAIQAASTFGDPFFFIKRQVAALCVGLVACVVCMRIPYEQWRVFAPVVAIIAIILLIMAVIPGVGINLKGSSRWLRLGPVNIQPSELAKFAMIILMARWLAQNQRTITTFKHGLFVPSVIIGVFAFLIIIEPDFGTTMLIGAVGFAMMFAGGTRFSYLLVAVVSGFSGIAYLISQNRVRMRRILAFINPEEYAENEGFQLLHAIYAFVIGGLGGVGLGDSLQKQFYLPEAHTDFIFAILGEELGLFASLFVILLFATLFMLGLWISYKATDPYGRLLAFGLTMMISIQAAINIGVVTGCLPTKGLPLPFISYGGTSLVMSLSMVGVLVNVAYHATDQSPRAARRGDRSLDA